MTHGRLPHPVVTLTCTVYQRGPMFSGWAYTPDRYVLCNYQTSSEHLIISRCCTIKYGGGAANNLKERPLVSGVEIYFTWLISPSLTTVQGVLLRRGESYLGRGGCDQAWENVCRCAHRFKNRTCLRINWQTEHTRVFTFASRKAVWMWLDRCLRLTWGMKVRGWPRHHRRR